MALSIKSAEAEQKIRELAALTGQSLTAAVLQAVDDQLGRERRRKGAATEAMAARILDIGRRCAALPTYDNRTSDEILGYDENGLPS